MRTVRFEKRVGDIMLAVEVTVGMYEDTVTVIKKLREVLADVQ